MQEDWVVMHNPGGSGGSVPPGGSQAEWLHVCFPSGWAPSDKVGRPLGEIHRPVADGDGLRAASECLTRDMHSKGPFVRHVWTLSASAALARDPDAAPIAPPDTIDAVQFRCERQVTVPLDVPGRAIFLIRVYVAPLVQIAADASRRATLRAALSSMSDAVVRYKAIGPLRELVLREWARAPQG